MAERTVDVALTRARVAQALAPMVGGWEEATEAVMDAIGAKPAPRTATAIRFDTMLHARLADAANHLGVSLNWLVNRLCSEGIDRLDPDFRVTHRGSYVDTPTKEKEA